MVSGSPIIVDKCQLGVNFNTDYPTLNLGSTVTGVAPIQKQLRLMNTSPKPCDYEWKMYDLDRSPGDAGERRKYFNIKIAPPRPGNPETVNLVFGSITPPESKGGVFTVTPM